MTWMTPERSNTYSPPGGTVAVVVDLRENIGGIKIHLNSNDDFVGMVGTEERGFFVTIPWQEEWNFYSVGSVRVGYITMKN